MIYAVSVLLSGDMRGALKNLGLVLVICCGCFANIHSYVDFPEDNLILDKSVLRAEIFVDSHFVISDLDVLVGITHPHIFDMTIELQKQDGPKAMLNYYEFDEFSFGADYDVVFDDQAPVAINNARLPLAGTYQPRDGAVLSVFDGLDAYGLWTINIYDGIYGDEGTLDQWGLMITNPEPATGILLLLGAVFLKRKKISNCHYLSIR